MEKDKDVQKCPDCKIGKLKENVSYTGVLGRRFKVITTYCPICPFTRTHKMKISQEDYMRRLDDEY